MSEDEKWMQIAIIEANIAKNEDEVPVGAVNRYSATSPTRTASPTSDSMLLVSAAVRAFANSFSAAFKRSIILEIRSGNSSTRTFVISDS